MDIAFVDGVPVERPEEGHQSPGAGVIGGCKLAVRHGH